MCETISCKVLTNSVNAFFGVVVALNLASCSALAAELSYYVKKSSWQESMRASVEALMKLEQAGEVGVSLPDLGASDFTVTAWVTNMWEISLVPQTRHLDVLTRWVENIRTRWPDAECPLLGDFGKMWRKQYENNGDMNYRFVERGTGIGGSHANLEIRWFMNKQFRLALLRDWQKNTPEKVIDFTRYDIPAEEPQDLQRNWSLMGQINQKETRPQDKPILLTELPAEERQRIYKMCPELKS